VGDQPNDETDHIVGQEIKHHDGAGDGEQADD
jgi:hypothetical protein